jgi:hypothetical protein
VIALMLSAQQMPLDERAIGLDNGLEAGLSNCK